MPEFKLVKGGLQDRALQSKAKIQIIGGGFGNGKTTTAVFKALQLSQDYPGFNCLMARSTYPKLNDTLRKEFLSWCPKDWIKSFPMSVNASNICTLKNGSTFVFRYIAQQGKNEESSTSNLLSATYDLIVVDQVEDPEITYKDFLDLVGRLRGQTPYRGTDPTMPRTGPRWMMLTTNPTRNWVYKKLVSPYHAYFGRGKEGDIDYVPGGLITDDLLCIRDNNGQPVTINGKPQLLLEIFEGSTYEAKAVLPEDFIQGLESMYQGQMKDRFLLGKWAAYEGLVYPQYDETVHMVSEQRIKNYLNILRDQGYDIEWIEGYDYGLASPSCYLLGFCDPSGIVIVVDGYYKKEFPIEEQFPRIKEIREEWIKENTSPYIEADPEIFRRGKGRQSSVTIADMFWQDADLLVRKADNSVNHGITKVSGYLNLKRGWKNPFTLESPSPSIFFNSKLQFITEEMSSWFWKKDNVTGEREDQPQSGNDHSLDTIKYLLTSRPEASKLLPSAGRKIPPWMLWQEGADTQDVRSRRHG